MKKITDIPKLNRKDKEGILKLFENEYWTKKRTMDDLDYLLDHTSTFVLLLDGDENAVGFGRGITDGRFIFTIYDVIIHPNHRHNGYGRVIMSHLTDYAVQRNIEYIELMCKDYNIGFYRKQGYYVEDSLTLMRLKDEKRR